MINDREGVSPNFNPESLELAQKTAKKIALLFASQVNPGMTYDKGQEILKGLMEAQGIEKQWHPSKFRIGSETTKVFREKPNKDVVLQEDDIYFVDIGPIINGHEADFAQTFTVGQNINYANAQKTAKKIFDEVKENWKQNSLTGIQIYEMAKEKAREYGFILNEKELGHRIGDFPHAPYYKGNLATFELTPKSHRWILEIMIADPENRYGAFYEDILI